jgi:hypothetical protein
MADQKVSDLPSLNGADVDAADLLYIVDSSAGLAGSKKITVSQYQVAPYSGAVINGVPYFDSNRVIASSAALTFDGTSLTAALTAASTAPTAASGTNTTQIATTAFVQTALRALHPVGSIYINATNSTNPGTLLGFGTWVAFGAGRVPVGFDAGNALFDTAEETGGSADAIAVTHTHTFSATTGNQSADHTHSGTTDSAGTHSHTLTNNYIMNAAGGTAISSGSGLQFGSSTDSAGAHTHTFSTGGVSANHTHSVSGTTGSTGSSGTNANYQPYITVYMWKRTA